MNGFFSLPKSMYDVRSREFDTKDYGSKDLNNKEVCLSDTNPWDVVAKDLVSKEAIGQMADTTYRAMDLSSIANQTIDIKQMVKSRAKGHSRQGPFNRGMTE